MGFRGRRENVKLFNEGGVTKRENTQEVGLGLLRKN